MAAEARYESFAREYAPILGGVICLILAILVARLITRQITRVLLYGILLTTMLFIYIERDAITECTQTCSCELAGFETSIPYCNRELPRTGE